MLEEGFPERVASEPELIARHYDQAGLLVQAIVHYQRAGERATQRSANEEAIGHLRRALDLVATLPETRERHQVELRLQMAIGAPLAAARGWSHSENEQAYTRARELTSQIGESTELPRVLAGMVDTYVAKGDLPTAAELATEALGAAERTGEAFDLLSAHYAAGFALLLQGHFSRALWHFEHSIKSYDPDKHGSLAYTAGFDRGASSLGFAGQCHMYLGHPDRALAVSEEAVALARRVEHPLSLAVALYWAGVVHLERGERDRTQERAGELVGLAEQLGFSFVLRFGRLLRAWARVESGEGEAGIAEMRQALDELGRVGSGIGAPQWLAKIAEGLRKVGRHDDAMGALRGGVSLAAQQGQHFYDAELHRLRAEILLDKDRNPVDEAEVFFGRALEAARRQEARIFELRAATSLARLRQRQGQARRRPRSSRPALRLVHRRLRHARPQGREGAARRARVRPVRSDPNVTPPRSRPWISTRPRRARPGWRGAPGRTRGSRELVPTSRRARGSRSSGPSRRRKDATTGRPKKRSSRGPMRCGLTTSFGIAPVADVEQASACEQAKQQVLAAKTDEEFNIAERRMRLPCGE